MLVLENPAAADELIREAHDFLESLHPRSKGIHVSDLIRCRRQAWYERRGYIAVPHSTQTLLLFLMGQGHHSLLEAGAEEVALAVNLDGIEVVGHVDHMEEEGFPGEIKTTRASAKKMKIPSDHYVQQAASYAVMKGVTRARIYAVFLLGDYTRAKLPSIKAWDLEFTELELRNWRREMGRRAHVLMGDEVPSLGEHVEWECNYCPFHVKRGGPCEGGEGTSYQWFPNQSAQLLVKEEEIG
jgi:CRISPR/Cas system-associated exonuclease Cas4 (RecB family)